MPFYILLIIMDKQKLFDQMINQQRKNIPEEYKLYYKDMKRIIKKIDSSIFNENCTIWKGYITFNKNYYVTFYLHNKKTSLHRILYINFIGDLFDNTYLTFKCKNKGCISLNCICIKKNKSVVTPKKSSKNKLFIVSFF